jgi:ABC-2 type transport system ATP-binding protein
VAEVLDVVGLTDRADDRVETYSGGMKRRLNIAVGLLHRPRLLILDEPTVGVDPQSRNAILSSIESLSSEGMAVLYTTHYMEEAERLCRRVAIIDKGRVLACDTVAALIGSHGGRSVVDAELDDAASSAAASLGSVRDGTLRFEAKDAREAVELLVAANVTYRALHVRRPDLESVFLELTGRRLRDE